jgi:hypothetical protein
MIRRIRQAAWFCLEAMTGTDKRLSWSKVITLAVLLIYAAGVALPATVAITAICAAHGTRVLLAAIARSSLASTSTTALSRVTTVARRLADLGIEETK